MKHLRASGGDDSVLDPKRDCVRGLEPFQTAFMHQEMQSKREFHQVTIILEQVRQSRLGIRDPERFRLLVAPQSEFALRRAQELAALDEHEVYGRVCRRPSLMMPLKTTTTNVNASFSLSDRILQLQQWNARRLMEIYQCGNGISRFPIRRDSLFGNMGRSPSEVTVPSRFPIRRDSLGGGPL